MNSSAVRLGFFWIAYFLCLTSALAQTFQKTISASIVIGSQVAYSVQQTSPDDGYIAVGYTSNFGAGDADVYLIKTNADGDPLWTKTFGGPGSDYGSSVQQTSDGGYIIAGSTDSFGFGGYDIFLIKTDAGGNELWTKTFGDVADEFGYSVRQTSNGEYIITGSTNHFDAGDVYVIKTDDMGNLLWTKTFGGTGIDRGSAVRQTIDGGFIVAGRTESFGAVSADVYLLKIDATGSWVWTKTIGTANYDYATSIQETTGGGFIIAGGSDDVTGHPDVYVIKTDDGGNLVWSRTYGDTDNNIGFAVHQTTDGGYVVAGYTYGLSTGNQDAYLIKIDSIGNLLWSKTFGGTAGWEIAHAVQQTTDGGYILSGSANSSGTGNDYLHLIKTDANGDSGCNQGNIATVSGMPTTLVAIQTPTVSSIGNMDSPTSSVGSGGVPNTLCTSVDIHEITTNDAFSIFPNPCSGDFVVTLKNSIDQGTVEVFGSRGEKVFGREIRNASKVEVKLENISEGMYVVNVFDGKNQYTKKVMIK